MDTTNEISSMSVLLDKLRSRQNDADKFMFNDNFTQCIIPEGVTEINNWLFEGFESLTNVQLPSTIKSIGDYAFSRTNISSITIPEGVTMIGKSAFFKCYSLTSIQLPSTVVSIGRYAFSNSDIQEITIPEGVISIDNDCCKGCTALTSVQLPSSITSIGEYAFSNTNISSITIPEGVTSIENDCFYQCSSLTSIQLPSSLLNIGKYTFCDASLHDIIIPEGVTFIGTKCFYNCTSLTNIQLPSTLKIFGRDAFLNTNSSLHKATEEVKSIRTERKKIMLNNMSVNSINKWISCNCFSQKLLDLALDYCRLKEIPDSIISLPNIYGVLNLSLKNNSIDNAEWIGQFSRLTYLNLSGNKIKTLSLHSTSLVGLFIHENSLKQVDLQLPNVKKVNLSNNEINLDTSVIQIPQVEEFFFNANAQDNSKMLSKISLMTNLKKLEMNIDELQSINEVMGCTHLKELSVEYNHLTEIPDSCSGLVELYKCSVKGNNLNAQQIQKLTTLSQLKKLDIEYNPSIDQTLDNVIHMFSPKINIKANESGEPDLIIDNLYLGTVGNQTNCNFLQANGVEYIITVGKFFLTPFYPRTYHYKVVPVKDEEYENIYQYFQECNHFIDSVIQNGGKVLVHCWCGISRSASIVIAYLMYKNQMTYEQAYSYVKSKRQCIDPNNGFKYQLKEYQKHILKLE